MTKADPKNDREFTLPAKDGVPERRYRLRREGTRVQIRQYHSSGSWSKLTPNDALAVLVRYMDEFYLYVPGGK